MKTLTTILLGTVAALGLAAAQPAAAPAKPAAPAAKTAAAKKHVAAANIVDINTASLDELKALPGVGDAYAQKIVAGRPYKGRNELLDRKILPSDVYAKIRLQVKARQPKTAAVPATKATPAAKAAPVTK